MSLFTHALTPEDLTAQKDRLYASILLNEGVVDVAGDAFEVNEDTGSNLNVRIGSGTVGDKAVVEGDSTADQGNYVVTSADATDTVTLSAGDNSDPRIDRVGILVQDDEADSSGQSEAILTVVEGTPASSPSAPAEPDNFLTLALVEVAAQASAITNSDITDARVEVRLTRASRDDGPRGVLGYSLVTSSTGSITSSTTLTTVNLTGVPANRLLRIEHYVADFSGTNAGDTFQLTITDGANSRLQARNLRIEATGTNHGGSMVLLRSSGAGGSMDFKARAVRLTGSGSGTHVATSELPAHLLVADLGPV